MTGSRQDEVGPSARNEVLLVGRVSGSPKERELPSGDLVVGWRVVVSRPVRRGSGEARAVTVDTIDCSAWTSATRRSAQRLADGDVVQVEGSLRRRFWRAAGRAASRCELEVATVRRLSRPGAPVGASAAASPAASAGAGRAVRRRGGPG